METSEFKGMEGMDDLERSFYELQENSSFNRLFSEPKQVKCLDMEFGFKIDPDHFIKWLIEEHSSDPMNDADFIEGDYRHNVGSECEFSCLYIALLLHDKDLESEPVIYCGNFGFWEHYWIGYIYKGQEYFIDLTLQQFLPDAPKLAISIPSNNKNGYNWFEDIEPWTISKYLERQGAFDFYLDPKNVK